MVWARDGASIRIRIRKFYIRIDIRIRGWCRWNLRIYIRIRTFSAINIRIRIRIRTMQR